MPLMHAVRVHAFGGPDALNYEAIEVPKCGPGEILVQVKGAGVGPWDAWVRAGESAVPQPLPLIPGSDVAGIVLAVGADVSGMARGDEVFGATNSRFTNGYAECALCEAGMLAPKPCSLSFVEAASAPVIAVTAWQMLFDHAGLGKGDTVLIHGAAGNVGSYAVQLARQAGLRIVATASPKHDERLRALGADTIVDPSSPASTTVNAVIDLVGGESQDMLLGWLGPRGNLISAVREPDTMSALEQGIHAAFIFVDVQTAVLRKLSALFDRGELKPWVGAVLPLAEAVQAHEMLAGALPRPEGKIVLIPAE
jgi:NADPH:quinone reductase-like Zn-dependent oxidoreductase